MSHPMTPPPPVSGYSPLDPRNPDYWKNAYASLAASVRADGESSKRRCAELAKEYDLKPPPDGRGARWSEDHDWHTLTYRMGQRLRTEERLVADLRARLEAAEQATVAHAVITEVLEEEALAKRDTIVQRMAEERQRYAQRLEEAESLITHKTEAHAEAIRRMVLAESDNERLREALCGLGEMLHCTGAPMGPSPTADEVLAYLAAARPHWQERILKAQATTADDGWDETRHGPRAGRAYESWVAAGKPVPASQETER